MEKAVDPVLMPGTADIEGYEFHNVLLNKS
jgi:hypothetical protein